MARGPLLVVALLLALGFSTCHRDLLSAFTVEWPEEVGRGPRGPDPWDPPSGGSNQAVQGNTVSSVLTPNPTVCMNYCKTVAGAKYYNYCNHPTNCGGIEIGGCACKSFEGQPQFVADPSGFISGPVDSSGATSTSENLFPATFSSPVPKIWQAPWFQPRTSARAMRTLAKTSVRARPSVRATTSATQAVGAGLIPLAHATSRSGTARQPTSRTPHPPSAMGG
eukprot:jgi/Botrbrau1/17164/Bobra.0157s0058.1